MSGEKMTPEQTAAISAGLAAAQVFATASTNPAVGASVAAASGLLTSLLAAQSSGADYTMTDFNAALAEFETLRAEGQRLEDAAG